MAVRKDKKLVTETWFAQWPVGSKAILRGGPSSRHHVIIVAHEVGATGWPVLRCQEEITGHTYYCLYGQRLSLSKPINRESR